MPYMSNGKRSWKEKEESRNWRLTAAALTIGLAATGCSAVTSTTASPPGGLAGTSHVAALNNDLGLNNAGNPGSAATPNPAGPPKDPFAGTPADNWPDGAAGIVLPTAEPIDGYTAAQVAYAYQTTKKLLVAGFLDKQTLLGGPPTAFANLLTPEQRTWFVQNLKKTGVDKAGAPLSSLGMIVSFPPGDAELIGSVIKVHGTMSAKTSVSQGQKELDVHLDYLFTYPIEPPGQPTEWMRIVAEAVWTVEFGNWQGASSTFTPSVQVDGGGFAGAQCDTKDGYTHPDYPSQRTAPNPSSSPTGTPVNPYALSGPGGGPTGCQATTGT
jgi:hypothetical protein